MLTQKATEGAMGWREDRIAWYLEEIARMHQGIELMKADIPNTGTEQSRPGALARAIGTLEGEVS
jgi:hypothetical protein